MSQALTGPISRRRFLGAAAGATGALLLPRAAWSAPPARDSIVLRWNGALLQGVRDSKLGPPMVARALCIAHTCMYDAWAAYDHRALGTQLGGALRQPPARRRAHYIRESISFAAYRAALDLFGASVTPVFDPLMAELGYDPADRSDDAATASGVGNLAAAAVLAFRHRDGANQLGDEPGGIPGVAYSDYTGYTPANAVMDVLLPFDPGSVHDPSRWQPLRYLDATGTVVAPAFVGAQWQRVAPFALAAGDGLRSRNGAARDGTHAYTGQARELLALSAGLTDAQKMIAEYWADGPHSELPPGHWNLFGQFVARRDRHGRGREGIERDVKLFFALTGAIDDAGCCAWDDKRAFDSVRPITAVRHLFNGTSVTAWAGPFQGARQIDGGAWLPYQPSTFPTPPFPEYLSGHSTFSAAGAEILRLFSGSDRFGGGVVLPAGSSRVEPGSVPARNVALSWATFSDAADEAGISRRYGGIHFKQGDLDGRALGRAVGRLAWERAQRYWKGQDVSR